MHSLWDIQRQTADGRTTNKSLGSKNVYFEKRKLKTSQFSQGQMDSSSTPSLGYLYMGTQWIEASKTVIGDDIKVFNKCQVPKIHLSKQDRKMAFLLAPSSGDCFWWESVTFFDVPRLYLIGFVLSNMQLVPMKTRSFEVAWFISVYISIYLFGYLIRIKL